MCTSDHLLCCLQLNLSANRLCGVWKEWDDDMKEEVQKGTYTSDGIQALADALCVSASVTSLNLSQNNLTNYGRDMTGITALAGALKVTASLTSVR